jgi:hypothetical protein
MGKMIDCFCSARSFGVMLLLILPSQLGAAQSNSWRGLIPLKSTRADVERLLGKQVDTRFQIEYKDPISDDIVKASFAKTRCDHGWDVPSGTLLELSVSSKADSGRRIDGIGIDKDKLYVTTDDAFFSTWTDPTNGLAYYTSPDIGLLERRFIPKRTDNNLRCDGFPPFAPEGVHFLFDNIRFYDSKAPRDSFNMVLAAIQALEFQITSSRGQYQGYALVYFDKRLSFSKYENRLRSLKKWTYRFLKVPKNDILFIEGGIRDRSVIEFYMLPKSYAPPAPEPTFPSPQFIKKSGIIHRRS